MRAFFLLIVAGGSAFGQRVELRCTADTWVQMAPWEVRADSDALNNHGAAKELMISGRNAFALLSFDTASLHGLLVSKATLRIHRAPQPVPLTEVGLSTISRAGSWNEGAQQNGRANRANRTGSSPTRASGRGRTLAPI